MLNLSARLFLKNYYSVYKLNSLNKFLKDKILGTSEVSTTITILIVFIRYYKVDFEFCFLMLYFHFV